MNPCKKLKKFLLKISECIVDPLSNFFRNFHSSSFGSSYRDSSLNCFNPSGISLGGFSRSSYKNPPGIHLENLQGISSGMTPEIFQGSVRVSVRNSFRDFPKESSGGSFSSSNLSCGSFRIESRSFLRLQKFLQ